MARRKLWRLMTPEEQEADRAQAGEGRLGAPHSPASAAAGAPSSAGCRQRDWGAAITSAGRQDQWGVQISCIQLESSARLWYAMVASLSHPVGLARFLYTTLLGRG